MARTEIARPNYRQDGLHYASDTTAEEWRRSRRICRWRDDGTRLVTNHALVMVTREMEGREASPSPGIKKP